MSILQKVTIKKTCLYAHATYLCSSCSLRVKKKTQFILKFVSARISKKTSVKWLHSGPTALLQTHYSLGRQICVSENITKKKGARRWFTECDIFFKGDQEDRKQKFSPQIEFNNWNNINNNNISTNRHLSKW